jgi:hypothetical protein
MNHRFLKSLQKSALPSLAIFLALPAAHAAETVFMVKSTADTGAYTLREALTTPANDHADKLTVDFSALGCTEAKPCVISLKSPIAFYGRNVEVKGPGSKALTIDNAGNSAEMPIAIHAYDYTSPESQNFEIKLSGMKIINTVLYPKSYSYTAFFEGIDSVQLTDVWFDHNDGNALVVIGGEKALLDGCVFSHNGNEASYDEDGHAVDYVDADAASIEAKQIVVANSVFNFNAQALRASGFNTLAIDKSAFYKNSTFGAHIYATESLSLATVTNSTFAAGTGMGIESIFTGSSTGSVLELVHSTITGNTGSTVGGLSATGYNGLVRLINSIIGGNSCTSAACSKDLFATNTGDQATIIESKGYNLIQYPAYVTAMNTDHTGEAPNIACNAPSDASSTSAVVCTPTSTVPNNVLDAIPMDSTGCHGTDVLVDQLDTKRPQGRSYRCDIGAIERKTQSIKSR